MKDNLIVLDGGKTLGEMRESIESLKDMIPYMKEHYILMAELTRVRYEALLKEGFTPEQALELSKDL